MSKRAEQLIFSMYCIVFACASGCINEQEALKLYGADVEDVDAQGSLEVDDDAKATNDLIDDAAGWTISDAAVTDITEFTDVIDTGDAGKTPDATAVDGEEAPDGCGNKCAEPPPPITGVVDPAWAFDANTGNGWLFGGETWYALSNTLFVYSAKPNAIAWTSKPDANGPPARARASMTASDDGKAAYLFAGQGYYALLNDLWQLKASTLTWTALKPGGTKPAERHGHIAFASAGLLVIGQGEGYYALREDWYIFDPQENTWTQLAAPVIPARRRATVATDATTGFTWIYGGEGYNSLLSDLWQLEIQGTKLVATQKVLDLNALPPVTNACALANAGQFWLTGGQSYYKMVPERWQLDLATGKSTSSPSGYASTGAICLRRKDGQAQWLLGQGFYEMSQIPLIFSAP